MSIKAKSLPRREELMAVFEYNPNTGIFLNKIRRNHGKSKNEVGDIATTVSRKKTPIRAWNVLSFKGKTYPAARVAWLFMTGHDPENMIVDHISGDSLDDRWQNLRLATLAENGWNRKLNKNNKTGFKGVTHTKNGTYCARFAVNKKMHLKYGFNTPEEAAAWIRAVRAQQHGNFYTHRGDATIEPQQLDLWQT
jgi:hypothetical protein